MNTYTYQIVDTGLGNQIILRSDGACIPSDPANSDYQTYLRWVENPDAEITPPTL
jgi:hypothetical protein